jgi:uncharacterized membrane protein (DUF106 family)
LYLSYLLKDSVIDELYCNSVIPNVTESKEYQKMLSEYNRLFDTIEDKELKNKLEKLKELSNDMIADGDKTTFKIGFSMGVKMVIEALNNNSIK